MRKISMSILIGLFAVALFVGLGTSGCSKSQNDENSPSSDGDRVIVSVDGVSLTARELSARADLVNRLLVNRRPNTSAAELKKRKATFCKVYPKIFVEDVVLSNFLAREKLELPREMITNFESRAAKTFGVGKKKKYADLKAAAGDLASKLDLEVLLEVRRQYVEDVLARRSPTNLPPNYVEQVQESVRKYNYNMGLTNAIIYARATNVWNQLKSGASFTNLVMKYSQADDDEKEEGGEWDSMDLTQLQDEPELKKWFDLAKTKVGDFSPPMECDSGLSIVRYDGVDTGEDQDEPTEYKFSRIHFLLPMFMEPDTPENIVAAAKKEHAKRLFNENLAKLLKVSRVIYTNSGKE